MLKNYLKVAWRSLIRNFSFSVINILGLAIGMASAILILLWVQNEMSHDRFHAKKDRLYRLNNRDSFNGEAWAWATTPKPMVPALKQEYPDVEDAVRVNDAKFLFTVGDKHLNLEGIFTDPGFLNTFSFPMLQGQINALNGNYNIVLTQKGAKKLFGEDNAMGKVVRLDSTDNFTVAGVLKDLPNNTKFEFDYLLPWSYMKKIGWDDTAWGNNSIESFVVLKPGVKQADFDKKIKDITIKHRAAPDGETTTHVFTQLFSDTWLYSKSENGQYVGGRISMVRLFTVIAGIILLIACINFLNLSTARSEKRAKEVGIRKAVGAKVLCLHFLRALLRSYWWSSVCRRLTSW
jgi:putative ABC transport system permease protein